MKEKETQDHPANAPPKKRRWKVILLGLVILFCGMIIGGGLTLHIGHLMIFHALNPGDEMASHISRRIDRKLDLTETQRSQVNQIVDRRVAAFKEILNEAYPQIQEQIQLMHDEVDRVLTEKQKVKWEEHIDNMKRRLERHKSG